MGKHYSHNDLAGCVSMRRSRQTGTLIGIYNGEQAGFDTVEGQNPWSLVCETHEFIVSLPSLQLARYHAAEPLTWCEFCNGTAHITTGPYFDEKGRTGAN